MQGTHPRATFGGDLHFILKYMNDIYKVDFTKAVHFDRKGFIRANNFNKVNCRNYTFKSSLSKIKKYDIFYFLVKPNLN